MGACNWPQAERPRAVRDLYRRQSLHLSRHAFPFQGCLSPEALTWRRDSDRLDWRLYLPLFRCQRQLLPASHPTFARSKRRLDLFEARGYVRRGLFLASSAISILCSRPRCGDPPAEFEFRFFSVTEDRDTSSQPRMMAR